MASTVRINRFISAALTCALCGVALAANAAPSIAVVSTGNDGQATARLAGWLNATGNFSAVAAIDRTTISYADLSGYDEVLFFTNVGGTPTDSGDALATYVQTGRRLVIAPFSFGQGGDNAVGGAFLSGGYSPFRTIGPSLYSNATIGSTDGSGFFSGVSSVTGFYRDNVVASTGATLRGSWSDGAALVATKGNVVGVNLFPDDSFDHVSGDNRQLFVDALISPIPEPSTVLSLLTGLLLLGGLRAATARRNFATQAIGVAK
ncbi:MAG: PEP-CTERM sorting domain-containing protein [Pseudomonadota bacterium]|nr:PEP-CTERM sorting domain-containing protein [Pseudomonadota bacterium]